MTSSLIRCCAEYVFFNSKRIARIDRPSGTVHYYFSDQVNSARIVARVQDSSNVIVEQESDFYPYGGEIVVTGGDTNHYKFTGKERDTETGLDNFGARYYSSGGWLLNAVRLATSIRSAMRPHYRSCCERARTSSITEIDDISVLYVDDMAKGACAGLS